MRSRKSKKKSLHPKRKSKDKRWARKARKGAKGQCGRKVKAVWDMQFGEGGGAKTANGSKVKSGFKKDEGYIKLK